MAPVGPDTPWTLVSVTEYIYDGFRVIQERDLNNTPTVSYTRGSDLSGSLEGAGVIGGLLARSDGYSSGNWTDHKLTNAAGPGLTEPGAESIRMVEQDNESEGTGNGLGPQFLSVQMWMSCSHLPPRARTRWVT